jgi:hypothetical protein
VFPVLAVIVIVVFAGLVFSQPWSRVTLVVYNQLEEPVIFSIYVDGISINSAVLIGANHTSFTDSGGGTFSPMDGDPARVSLHAVIGSHEFGIDVSRYEATADGPSFRGDNVVDVSRSISVGFLTSNAVVLVIS